MSRTAGGLRSHAQKRPAGSHSAQATSSRASPPLRWAPVPFPLPSGFRPLALAASQAGQVDSSPSPLPTHLRPAACTTEEVLTDLTRGLLPPPHPQALWSRYETHVAACAPPLGFPRPAEEAVSTQHPCRRYGFATTVSPGVSTGLNFSWT